MNRDTQSYCLKISQAMAVQLFHDLGLEYNHDRSCPAWAERTRAYEKVRDELLKVAEGTLGQIVATGKGRSYDAPMASSQPMGATRLDEVHHIPWLDQHGSGPELLLRIATTAMLALIYDHAKAMRMVYDRASER